MKKPVRRNVVLSGAVVVVVALASVVHSHCQIPCGIYGDSTRFDMIAEHITTIERSMKQIVELSEMQEPDMNQIVRWVQNKDKHADDLAHVVTYYFMAQRVKPVDSSDSEAYRKYIGKLTILHQMLVHSMKAKQTTDLLHVEKLRSLLEQFRSAYFGQTEHKH
jgi:nickel superoxide dismutase